MINITNEEYRTLIKAQAAVDSIKWVLNNDEEFGYDSRKIEVIHAILQSVPEKIPFNDPHEKEELF